MREREEVIEIRMNLSVELTNKKAELGILKEKVIRLEREVNNLEVELNTLSWILKKSNATL